jgi:hypothetical protein
MITCYNRIAGQSVEPRRSEQRHFRRGHDSSCYRRARSRARIDAPRARPPHSSLRRLTGSPRLPAEFSCFGNFLGQQSQLNHLRRSDIRLTWIHLAFLFAVTLMPFSTKLLGTRHVYRTAYSNTGVTSSSLAPCFTPAGLRHPRRPHQGRHLSRSARCCLSPHYHRSVLVCLRVLCSASSAPTSACA